MGDSDAPKRFAGLFLNCYKEAELKTPLSLIVFISLLGFSSWIYAPCLAPTFTETKDVRLANDEVLIVTHISNQWDQRYSTKLGVDRLVAQAMDSGVPVVYLQDPSAYKTYFYDNCHPTYYVKSLGGEFSFDFDSRHVVTAGGYNELCQGRSMSKILKTVGKHDRQDLEIDLVTDAIYTAGGYIPSGAPYLPQFNEYIRIFGAPTISLLHLMRIIKEKPLLIEYLQKYLSSLSSELPPTHRTVVQVNSKQEFIHSERVGAPTLTLNFRLGDETPFYSR